MTSYRNTIRAAHMRVLRAAVPLLIAFGASLLPVPSLLAQTATGFRPTIEPSVLAMSQIQPLASALVGATSYFEPLSIAQTTSSTQRLVAGGLIGGGAGLLAGGLVGAYIGGNRCTDPGNPDSCSGLEGFVIGAMAGQAIGIPLGVHLANHRRGRLGVSLAASAAIAAAGAGMVSLNTGHGAAVGVAVAVPVAQLVTSILIERRTGSGR